MLETVGKRALEILGLLIVILALVGGWYVWSHWFHQHRREDYYSVIVGAQPRSKLITGFAYVSVMLLKSRDGKSTVEDWFFTRSVPKEKHSKLHFPQNEVRGLCHRLYKVAFGYPDFASASASYGEGKRDILPTMLDVEAVQVFERGNMTVKECNDLDTSEDHRRQLIKRRMLLDGLLESQYEQGCQLLSALPTASLTKASTEPLHKESSNAVASEDSTDPKLASCLSAAKNQAAEEHEANERAIWTAMVSDPYPSPVQAPTGAKHLVKYSKLLPLRTVLAELRDPQTAEEKRQLLGSGSGVLGSLVVTVSTVGSVGYESGWFLWKSEQFYARRDITDATYGSAIKTASLDLDSNVLSVVAETPTLVARNRRIDLSLGTDKYDDKVAFGVQDGKEENVDQQLLRSIDIVLKDIQRPAVRLSQIYLREALQKIAGQRRATLDLRFE